MTEKIFGHSGAFDHCFQIDARLDTHFVAHENDVFGTDIARRALVFGKRTPPKPGNRTVELVNAHPQRRIDVGHARSPGVVQMQADPQVRPPVAHRIDSCLDVSRRGETDRICEVDAFQALAIFLSKIENGLHHVQNLRHRHLAFETATERGHDISPFNGDVVVAVDVKPAPLLGLGLCYGLVGIANREGLGRRHPDRTDDIEWQRQRTFQSARIEPEPGIANAIALVDGPGNVIGICHIRHAFAAETRRVAAGMQDLGIARGEVVAIFMPSVPEAIAAFLAIVSFGAIALPVFSGFGEDALVQRLADAGAVAIVTADRTFRRGKEIGMARKAENVRPQLPALRHVIVVPRNPETALENPGWISWSALQSPDREQPPIPLPAETVAMLVYTSGTSGKAKGSVHSHCGFMVKTAADYGLVHDLNQDDRLLWMSDMGWLTGPMLAAAVPMMGAGMVLAEGTPDWPDAGRLWRLVEEFGVTFLGVAPTMIRAAMQHPPGTIEAHDLSSLRITAATGEPWTPDAWEWFREKAGRNGEVPLLNYSGGTEIGGGILGTSLLHRDVPPCAFGGPLPGMQVRALDAHGQPIRRGEVGELALAGPSIGLSRGLWHDPDRYIASYWSARPGMWMHGDFVSIDKDGHWYLHGRSDDTIKIAGKRTGPAEIESLLLATGLLAEAAAVGIYDPVKGQALACVCVPAQGVAGDEDTAAKLGAAVVAGLGSSFRPKRVVFVPDLPKTRTMKLMRRVVRSGLEGSPPGDLSGIVNPEAVDMLATAVVDARST